MKNYLHKLSGAENVYFIGEDYIGKMLLEQAAERPTKRNCIIYCGNGIDIIKENRKKELRSKDLMLLERKMLQNTLLKFKKNVTNSIE